MSKEIKQKADDLVGLFKPYSKIFVDCTNTQYDDSIKCAILHQKRLIEELEASSKMVQMMWFMIYNKNLEEQKEILTELKNRL